MRQKFPLIFMTALFLVLLSVSLVSADGEELDDSPPLETQKLVFIHHSCGENWLSTGNGGLGQALGENNYFVSDTNYGWGPNSIGDATDIPDWLRWFRSDDTPEITEALFNEFSNDWYGWQYYDRPMADPGGENDIILFKSCYPNSELWGNPDDSPGDDADWTVAGAKYVYNELLQFFIQHPEKLFIVITAPPSLNRETGENARAFNDWLVNEWLISYTGTNVAVWDFYAVLSHKNNHHRFSDNEIDYINTNGNGTAAYDSWGDPHPNQSGNQKATEEFVPVLNIYVNRWLSGLPAHVFPTGYTPELFTQQPNPADSEEEEEFSYQEQPIEEIPSQLIDNFDGELHWEAYHGENATIRCELTPRVHISPPYNLEIIVDVPQADWASCEYYFDEPGDFTSSLGLTFQLYSDTKNFPYTVLIYAGDPQNPDLFGFDLMTTENQYQVWQTVQIPWKSFNPISNDSAFLDLSQVEGIVFAFGTDSDISGTIAVEDMVVGNLMEPSEGLIEMESVLAQEEPTADSVLEEDDSLMAVRDQLCGSVFLIPLLPITIYLLNRKKNQ